MSEELSIKELEGVGSVTAKKLKEVGIETIQDLASWDGHSLARECNISLETSTKYINNAYAKLADEGTIQGQFITAEQHLELTDKIERISTGSSSLDELFGGGIETQAITELFGQFGSGKSQICFTLCCTAQQLGNVFYLDTEGTFSSTRVQEIARARQLDPTSVLSNIVVCKVSNSSQLENIVKKMSMYVRTYKIKLIVVDSIIALHRAEFSGRGTLADRQQHMNEVLHKLLRVSEIQKVAVVVTNQVVTDPGQMFGDPNKPTGGNVIGHTMTYRVYLSKIGRKRKARMYDSPKHEEMERIFMITERGVDDIQEE